MIRDSRFAALLGSLNGRMNPFSLPERATLLGRFTYAGEAFGYGIRCLAEFVRGRGILCQGRGSAAKSAVCYCLDITYCDR